MLSKIEELIRVYLIKIGTIAKRVRNLSKSDDYELYVALLKERDAYVNMVNDLRDIIK